MLGAREDGESISPPCKCTVFHRSYDKAETEFKRTPFLFCHSVPDLFGLNLCLFVS